MKIYEISSQIRRRKFFFSKKKWLRFMKNSDEVLNVTILAYVTIKIEVDVIRRLIKNQYFNDDWPTRESLR